MLKTKLKVGHYYELIIDKNQKILFGVMYGFNNGKNKEVYSLMMYAKNKIFEFPIQKNLFKKWVDESRVKEINYYDLLKNII